MIMLAFTADSRALKGVAGFFQSAIEYTGYIFLTLWVFGVVIAVAARLFKKEGVVAYHSAMLPFWVGVAHVTLWIPFFITIRWK